MKTALSLSLIMGMSVVLYLGAHAPGPADTQDPSVVKEGPRAGGSTRGQRSGGEFLTG